MGAPTEAVADAATPNAPTRRSRRAARTDVPATRLASESPLYAALVARAEPAPRPEPAAPGRPAPRPEPAARMPPIFRPPPPPADAAEPRAIPLHTAASGRRARPSPLVAGLSSAAPARHARRRRRAPLGRLTIATALAAAMVLGGAAAMTAAVSGRPVGEVVAEALPIVPQPEPTIEASIVAPAAADPTETPPQPSGRTDDAPAVQPAAVDLCAIPAVAAALAAGDDTAAIAAAGGAGAFRAAVAGGTLPCANLADPARVWVVVDKHRPLAPVDYAPAPLALPAAVRSLQGGELRADAGAALAAMVEAAGQAGVGEIAVESGYRSYRTQVTSYGNQVSARGVAGADLVSARPGYSEHQTGLAADVVGCDSSGACGTLDDLAASPQGRWVAAHAWEYGWIVRYEAGSTPVSGYDAEPWHLRYIGVQLAAAYHDGGWHTLEEFFGLPAATDYVG